MRNLTCGLLLALCVTGTSLAGPITPPPGPVVSTPGPEPRVAINATNTPGDADSLFKITQRGSYYLTGNITGVAGKHGIEIAISGVTLDLNGFDLVGVAGMGNFDGVNVTLANLTTIAVVNGSVRNWGRDGVNLGNAGVAHGRVDGVRASGNVVVGIYAGNFSTVSMSSGSGGQYGIYVSAGSTVSDCTATGSSAYGIYAEDGSVLTRCVASTSGVTGTGIFAGESCSVSMSSGSGGGYGIFVAEGSTVSDCTATGSALVGIFARDGSTLSHCSAYQNNGDGIVTESVCMITDCSAALNQDNGIECGFGSTVSGCTAGANAVYGIRAGAGCTVTNCSASSNGSAGIGAGIHVTGNGGRYDSNHTVSNYYDGMSFANGTLGNVITRNYSTQNGGFQYRLEGGGLSGVSGPTRNECAPIYSPAAVNGVWPAGNTNPWANMQR